MTLPFPLGASVACALDFGAAGDGAGDAAAAADAMTSEPSVIARTSGFFLYGELVAWPTRLSESSGVIMSQWPA